MSQISVADLQKADAWANLRDSIDPGKNNFTVAGLIENLKSLGAVSCLIEDDYLDQDFTDLYSKFYVKIFKRHTKVCRRFHFFEKPVHNLFNTKTPTDIIDGLKSEETQKSYLGFIVVRPVRHSPIGRAVIAAPPSPAGFRSELLVTSRYEVHICGQPFYVYGMALTQQESRVGACAQATIWMAGRHFHNKYKGPWISTAAITEVATANTVTCPRKIPPV